MCHLLSGASRASASSARRRRPRGRWTTTTSAGQFVFNTSYEFADVRFMMDHHHVMWRYKMCPRVLCCSERLQPETALIFRFFFASFFSFYRAWKTINALRWHWDRHTSGEAKHEISDPRKRQSRFEKIYERDAKNDKHDAKKRNIDAIKRHIDATKKKTIKRKPEAKKLKWQKRNIQSEKKTKNGSDKTEKLKRLHGKQAKKTNKEKTKSDETPPCSQGVILVPCAPQEHSIDFSHFNILAI